MKWLLLQWKQNVSDLLINPCLSCQTTLQNNGEQNFLLYILLPISLWQQKKISARKTEKDSVRGLQQAITMQLSSVIPSLKKSLFLQKDSVLF